MLARNKKMNAGRKSVSSSSAAAKRRRRSVARTGRMALGVENLERRQLLSGGGVLDESFGMGGKVVTDVNLTPNYGYSLALADGKILVAGSVGVDSDSDMAVYRYNSDGSLDLSFGGGDGIATVDLGGSGYDKAYALAVLGDGSILLAGESQTDSSYYDMAVVKLSSSGVQDMGFGTGGKTLIDFYGANKFDQANSILVQGDGKILVSGPAVNTSDMATFGLARLNSDGSMDTSFGSGGKVTTDWSSDQNAYYANSYAMALVGGEIVLAGSVMDWNAGTSDVGMAWYNSDGSLSHTGLYDWGNHDDSGKSMVVDAGGKLLVAGYSLSYDTFASSFVVMRLNADGSLDTTFNGTGLSQVSLSGGTDLGLSVALQADGAILVAGQANGGTNDLGLIRLLSDGTLDTSFGNSGVVRVDMNFSDDVAHSVTVDGDGKILLVGVTTADWTDFDVALVRLSSTSGDGGSELPENASPVADAGGPYHVNEGVDIMLSGAGSEDSDGTIVSYEWDFDFNGSSFDVDATGVEALFLKLDGPTMRTVALRVTDNLGAVHVVTTTVEVHNVGPVASVSGPELVKRNKVVTFHGSLVNACEFDTHEVRWDFGDGTVIDWQSSENAGALDMNHVYAAKGQYMVTFSVRDNDGSMHSVTLMVTVQNPRVFYLDAAETMLMAEGGDGAEQIEVRRGSSAGKVKVFYDGVLEGEFAAKKVLVDGLGGNDVLTADPLLSLPVEMSGGGGNDVLFAGLGNATLRGGSGNDWLIGGEGYNYLDGGDGNDVLYVDQNNKKSATLLGGSGNDILHGGRGDDLLDAGMGDDYLIGNKGKDLLKGGFGRDTYIKLESKDRIEDPDMARPRQSGRGR